MDLRLVARVAWRFKIVVVIGLLLAGGAAVFVNMRLGGKEEWQSLATLHVTQKGDPSYRAVIPQLIPPSAKPGESTRVTPEFADPSRFTTLAADLAKLSTSDQIRRQVLGANIGNGDYSIVGEQLLTVHSDPLPFILLTATAPTASEAVALRDATVSTVRRLFSPSDVPAAQRVLLQSVSQPAVGETSAVTLVKGRSKTMPVAAFLVIAFLAFALAFLLENLRPRSAAALGIQGDGETQRPASVHAEDGGSQRLTTAIVHGDLGRYPDGGAVAWPERLTEQR